MKRLLGLFVALSGYTLGIKAPSVVLWLHGIQSQQTHYSAAVTLGGIMVLIGFGIALWDAEPEDLLPAKED